MVDMSASRRTKPVKTLVEFHTMETFATLEDMRERTYHFKYIADTDGFLFKRFVRDDNAPTRWSRIRGPKKDETPEELREYLDSFIERIKQKADRHHVTLAVDNR